MVLEAVIIIVGVLSLCIGILIGSSDVFLLRYRDGDMVIDETDKDTNRWSLNLNTPLDEFPNKQKVIFSVKVKK